ncbi:MAG: transcription antitermination factor NusB [Bacillota bacterium]|nr:transcription antitermination factor NusB [Bacillota bacterium]
MSRRTGRELALRALFMVEQGQMQIADALEKARAGMRPSADAEFAREILQGTVDHLVAVDAAILSSMQGWTMLQMAATDRAVLRLAAYELLFSTNPVGAIINEAVALAKSYGTPESGRFVNGVLGSIARSPAVGDGLIAGPPSPPDSSRQELLKQE